MPPSASRTASGIDTTIIRCGTFTPRFKRWNIFRSIPCFFMIVGVIIPALNEEKATPLVLKDLHNVLQTCPVIAKYEIIVADNGSTDRTAEAARAGGARVVQ